VTSKIKTAKRGRGVAGTPISSRPIWVFQSWWDTTVTIGRDAGRNGTKLLTDRLYVSLAEAEMRTGITANPLSRDLRRAQIG
jgi:hypothetical protein